MKFTTPIRALVVLAVVYPLTTQAVAQDRANDAELKRRIDALEKRLERTEKRGVATGRSAGKGSGGKAGGPTITFKNGRPKITSADGQHSLSLRARMHIDAAAYDQKRGATPDLRSDPDLNSGTAVRRARLGIKGQVFGDVEYELTFNFGGSGAADPGEIQEARLSYVGLPNLAIDFGVISAPITLGDTISSNASVFLEQGSISDVAAGLAGGSKRAGVGARYYNRAMTASAFFTGAEVGDGEINDEQIGTVGRVTVLPLALAGADSKSFGLHLGGSVGYVIQNGQDASQAAGSRKPIRLRQRPELNVDSSRLVDTGNINADSAVAYGAELAVDFRNVSLQAEYYGIDVARTDLPTGLDDPSFGGYYAQLSYIITGEPRRYSRDDGAYSALRPKRPFMFKGPGWGAFEVAYRYSLLDLDSDAADPVAANRVRGGVQVIHTVGLNWYLNRNVRFMLNYLWVDVDRLNAAGAQIGQAYQAAALRTQFTF